MCHDVSFVIRPVRALARDYNERPRRADTEYILFAQCLPESAPQCDKMKRFWAILDLRCNSEIPVSFPFCRPPATLSRFRIAGFGRVAAGTHAGCGGHVVDAEQLGAWLVGHMTAITLDQLFLGWRDRIAVRDASGTFRKGTMTAIVGPNGAGKTTLIRGIMGQISPLRGHIRLGVSSKADLACMPQTDQLDQSFPITAYDLVALGAWRRVGAWRGYQEDEHVRVQDALKQVGMADYAASFITTLSGGQLQRVLFARLLMHDAQIMLLDEPFAAVDRATTDDLLAILAQWKEQGRTVIVVLHDLDVVRAHFPQTLLLARQVVHWGPTAEALTPENLHLARHLCAGDGL